MKLTAQSIVIELLSASWPDSARGVPVRLIIDACEIFDFSENSVRVALAKMRADGLVESPTRGRYVLGPAARPITEKVSEWRSVAGRVIDWDRSWIGVWVGHLPRTNRAAVRRRMRALRMLGFRELEEGMHLRPNNLRGEVKGVRASLNRLSSESGALVCRVDELSKEDERRARSLWEVETLADAYIDLHARLSASIERRREQSLNAALREAYLLGREVIRAIVLDPLLPEPMVSNEEREKLIGAMIEYADSGTALWRRYLGARAREEAAA